MSNPKKQNKMDLSNFQKTVYQSVDRKVVGTVREAMEALYGANARLAPANSSVRSSKAKFTLKAFDKDNALEWTNLVCSTTVSEGLRNKEITLRQVLDFPIIEHTVGEEYANAGLVLNLVSMPTGIEEGDVVTVGINDKAEAAFAPTFNPSELIAL
jgi:hypothetical protein